MSKLDKAFEAVVAAEALVQRAAEGEQTRYAVLARLEATERWLNERKRAAKKLKAAEKAAKERRAAEAEAARCAGGEPA